MERENEVVYGSDSTTYRKIFEFIGQEGIEPFEKLVCDIIDIDKYTLTRDGILKGKQPIMSLVCRNKLVIEFLRQFNNYFLSYGPANTMDIDSPDFLNFITYTSRNMDKLDTYIENAKKLEELKISNIKFFDSEELWSLNNRTLKTVGLGATQIWKESKDITTIRKHYSDGIINYTPVKFPFLDDDFDLAKRAKREYEEFKISLEPNKYITNSPSWLIQSENHENGYQFRYALIENFDFNSELLPTNEQLNSYEEPQSLKLYKKEMKNRF